MLPSHQLVGGMNSDLDRKPNHPLHMSWTNSQFPAHLLNADNIMDYFMTPNNPFYDKSCLNETLRMQGRSGFNIDLMEGVQYKLYQALEPLFVIRKVERKRDPTRPQTLEETPLANFYIIQGTVYKTPDLASVINARVLSALCNIQASFAEARSYSRYHPSKGYWWEFEKPGAPIGARRRVSRANSAREDEPSTSSDSKTSSKHEKETGKTPQDTRTTLFQRTRVDGLLALLSEQFPPVPESEEKPGIETANLGQNERSESNGNHFGSVKREFGVGLAQEDKGPSAKRIKLEDS